MSKWKKAGIWGTPIAFSVYSVLALYSYNIVEIRFVSTLRTLAAVAGLAVGIVFCLNLFLRNRMKASMIATIWLLVFISYGHIYNLLDETPIFEFTRNEVLLPLSVLLLAGSFLWIWKAKKSIDWLLSFFGTTAAVLIVFTMYTLVNYFVFLPKVGNKNDAPIQTSATQTPGAKPDIYYIILDAYGRSDILQGLYDFDNSSFIDQLKQDGFYVADASHSNYPQTLLSLASSLNMDYIDALDPPTRDPKHGRVWLTDEIHHSLVRQALAQQGYKLISFDNDWLTTIEDADYVYSFEHTELATEIEDTSGFNKFETLYLSSTLGRIFFDLGWLKDRSDQEQYLFHYQETRYIFDQLEDVHELPGSYFVFAHLIVPHPPFVFSSDGGFVQGTQPFFLGDGSAFAGTPEEYVSGYRNQVAYVDDAVTKLVMDILANSDPAPIIIIQADHGPGSQLDWNSADNTNLDERFGILNAYYFPGNLNNGLYPSISPVNSFRLVLDDYFGMNLPFLPDKSYFSTWDDPLKFIDITGSLKK
ncbi:MAG TPA: sulfatase-like hydrolase/transferase [Anaerolineales bacterium]|nr:sulfatase-like hydrolase/transferase [Anaerolineales bacterium]